MKTREIHTIGIPRALVFYRYGVLWQRFLEECGFEVVLSGKTDAALFEVGDKLAEDESCVALKTYLGHAASLVGKCDALFIPCYDSCDVRAGFCTRYQSLPDLVRATFRDQGVEVLSFRIEKARDRHTTKHAYLGFAKQLGVAPVAALEAYETAIKAQAAHEDELAQRQRVALECILHEKAAGHSLAVLVIAHPYIVHDEYISGGILGELDRLGATVIFADDFAHDPAFDRSFEFSETIPWIVNRELIGTLMNMRDYVDGVVLLTAFPCGPDSLADDAIVRYIEGTPVLQLMIDAQSGSAGVATRVESFIDILRYRGKGAYLDS